MQVNFLLAYQGWFRFKRDLRDAETYPVYWSEAGAYKDLKVFNQEKFVSIVLR